MLYYIYGLVIYDVKHVKNMVISNSNVSILLTVFFNFMIGWFVGFYGITFVGYLMPNLFYLKQFSLA